VVAGYSNLRRVCLARCGGVRGASCDNAEQFGWDAALFYQERFIARRRGAALDLAAAYARPAHCPALFMPACSLTEMIWTAPSRQPVPCRIVSSSGRRCRATRMVGPLSQVGRRRFTGLLVYCLPERRRGGMGGGPGRRHREG
jgi:hypothetical protein